MAPTRALGGLLSTPFLGVKCFLLLDSKDKTFLCEYQSVLTCIDLESCFSHNPWHIVLSACKYWENPKISVFLLYSVWDNGSGLWTYIPFALVTFSSHRYEGLIEQAPWPSAQSHIQHVVDPLIHMEKEILFSPHGQRKWLHSEQHPFTLTLIVHCSWIRCLFFCPWFRRSCSLTFLIMPASCCVQSFEESDLSKWRD